MDDALEINGSKKDWPEEDCKNATNTNQGHNKEATNLAFVMCADEQFDPSKLPSHFRDVRIKTRPEKQVLECDNWQETAERSLTIRQVLRAPLSCSLLVLLPQCPVAPAAQQLQHTICANRVQHKKRNRRVELIISERAMTIELQEIATMCMTTLVTFLAAMIHGPVRSAGFVLGLLGFFAWFFWWLLLGCKAFRQDVPSASEVLTEWQTGARVIYHILAAVAILTTIAIVA